MGAVLRRGEFEVWRSSLQSMYHVALSFLYLVSQRLQSGMKDGLADGWT